ncbi:MAG TPA: DMT family transporter [Acidobacteriaceae bacterium]|jgi:drug/metabolite transporter (DMT)-like permease|nr:DMT family transporter [Acidobacteriaceae bacterium]
MQAKKSILSRNVMAHLLMLAIVMLWGATFVQVKDALQDISPQLFNTLRMMIAFVCLAVVYRQQWKHMSRLAVGFGLLAGVCLTVGYVFQTSGLLYTSATNSAFITGLMVVIVPLLAAIPALRPPGSRAPGWNTWLGALAAFGGIALLTTPAHTDWSRLLGSLNHGDLLTLGCAVGFSFHVIVLAHATRRVPFQQIALLMVGFAALMLGSATGFAEHPFLHPTLRLLVALLVTGVLATAAAFTVQTWAQQILPATNTALILALEPVFAWLTAFALLQEHLEGRRVAGALLILAGILVTELVRQPENTRESPTVSAL